MNYCRKGWKNKPLFLASEDKKAGTCSLKDEAGTIVVSGLPLVEDPSKLDPATLPKSYATPLPAETGGSSAPTVDPEKVAAILSKAHEPASKVSADDLERVNVPTLRAIVAGLELPEPPKGAKSDGIKKAIMDAANATAPAGAGGAKP